MIKKYLASAVHGSKLIYSHMKNDIVFSIALILAIVSCFFSRPSLSYIDFKVLACLFNLMLVIKAFEELHILDKFAVGILNKCTHNRQVSLLLIVLCFFSSMLITNDIALLTFVPLTLIIGRKSNSSMLLTVVLETLAANIGSSLTPMGNPQNLFIFSYYKLVPLEFFSSISFFAVTGLIYLYILNLRSPKNKLNIRLEEIKIKSKAKTIVWTALFLFIILSVFELVDYKTATLVTIILTLFLNYKLLLRADYNLLLTFICFFIFIGNISAIPSISDYLSTNLNSGKSTYLASIILSQFISNVPCAIFLSKFTAYWKELLLGVNIGGMGTIIASLASVISYKLFIADNSQSQKRYIYAFSLYNFISLLIFTVLNYILIF